MSKPEIIAHGGTATAGWIGVVIVNLGTPDATDAASVRRYLREFLSDSRVIENQGLVWKFVLNAIILTNPKALSIADSACSARSGSPPRSYICRFLVSESTS